MTATATAAFNRLTDPLVSLFSPEVAASLLSYRGDGELAARIEELARKSNEGELSVDEAEEYQGYVRANKFIAVLQAKARKSLTKMASQ